MVIAIHWDIQQQEMWILTWVWLSLRNRLYLFGRIVHIENYVRLAREYQTISKTIDWWDWKWFSRSFGRTRWPIMECLRCESRIIWIQKAIDDVSLSKMISMIVNVDVERTKTNYIIVNSSYKWELTGKNSIVVITDINLSDWPFEESTSWLRHKTNQKVI
jgi:hypothetical protein